MVCPVDVKQKGGALVMLVGYWMNYVTSAIDLTHDLDLGYFKLFFLNSYISGIVGLFDVKRKGSKSVRHWADYITFPFDHTHDLDF